MNADTLGKMILKSLTILVWTQTCCNYPVIHADSNRSSRDQHPQFRGFDSSGQPLFSYDDAPERKNIDVFTLVEPFTGETLSAGEFKFGTEWEYGMSKDWMIGTDTIALLLGAPSLYVKVQVYEHPEHKVAVGLRAAFISRDTIYWGNMPQHFERLQARYFRPSLSYTHVFSQRLRLHTFLTQGFGSFDAELSDYGKRRLWSSKYPSLPYPADAPEAQDSSSSDAQQINQESRGYSQSQSRTQRTVQVASIAGLMADVFQMTGEFSRDSGNKVLLTTRMERMILKDLSANNIRLTLAQQWIWPSFQIRLGAGLQYSVLYGRDLDDESINEAELLPASDIMFYWRF